MLNGMSRYDLASEALKRSVRFASGAPALVTECQAAMEKAVQYADDYFEDPPEIREWHWT